LPWYDQRIPGHVPTISARRHFFWQAFTLAALPAEQPQVLLSLEVYIFAPQLQLQLTQVLPLSRALLPAGFAAVAVCLVVRQSVLLTSALLCMLGFVTLLCPMWLVRIHKFKAQINGPWDEAAPRLSSTLAAPC